MANQTSCYQVVEKPGAAYCYNDWQMALIWNALFLKAYGVVYGNVDATVTHQLTSVRRPSHVHRLWSQRPTGMAGDFGP